MYSTKTICGKCRRKKYKQIKRKPCEKELSHSKCRTCKLTKDKDFFYKDKTRYSGLSSECKECRSIRGSNSTKSGYYTSEKYKKYFAESKEKIYAKRKANGWKYPIKGSSGQLLQYMRNRIYYAIKKGKKSKTTIDLLGISSIEELWIFLEKKFQDGMSRSNYGEWHVDHIKPCSLFDLSDPQQQAECFHYTNLQPLWAVDNLRKSNKV